MGKYTKVKTGYTPTGTVDIYYEDKFLEELDLCTTLDGLKEVIRKKFEGEYDS